MGARAGPGWLGAIRDSRGKAKPTVKSEGAERSFGETAVGEKELRRAGSGVRDDG